MSIFTVVTQGGPHLLRSSEHVQPNYGIAVDAVRIGSRGQPNIRVTQNLGDAAFSQELSADMARALAAELLASADAIDAVTIKRSKT
ncbi:hypothetical protein ACNQFN_11405 [Thauera butanivorans]|uniref:hypothetical protein n=1 Tax=Thauera butanivorans TaxID=86174 RepID=UPI003AB6F036